MKVLVTGGSGGIGSRFAAKLVREGHAVYYSYFNNNILIKGARGVKLDISDSDKVASAVKTANPDVVIHTAATQSADICETNHEIADGINVAGTQNVADACAEAGSRIIFISSCFVFDGRKEIYAESDKPNPVNYYGETKLCGERIIRESGCGHIIARSDQLYSWISEGQRMNTAARTVQNLRKGEECREPTDWKNCPTFSDNCADVIWALLNKGKEGIFHVVGGDFLSRYEWACKVADVFGLDRSLIKPISSSEFNLPAKRPNARLSNAKAQRDSGIELVGVEEGARTMRENENI